MDSAVSGQPPVTRARRALEATQRAMSDAIGRMYVERHFSAAQQARVQGIVATVAAAFVRHVEAATWLSPATRAMALAKLQRLYVGIGFPERWEDYADLGVDPTDALGNHRRALERAHRQALAHTAALAPSARKGPRSKSEARLLTAAVRHSRRTLAWTPYSALICASDVSSFSRSSATWALKAAV